MINTIKSLALCKKSLISFLITFFAIGLTFSQQKPIPNIKTDLSNGSLGDSLKGLSTSNEVVSTGYGTQKKREVTSSISNVNRDEFNKGNIQNPLQLIQGKVAGLSINKPGGDPNGAFDVRLRGLNTIYGNTAPLVIVDGVIDASLNNVDPEDIESIDVLKDASTAAIYGTRGSSGVILVSTRRGKPGKTVIEYNVY